MSHLPADIHRRLTADKDSVGRAVGMKLAFEHHYGTHHLYLQVLLPVPGKPHLQVRQGENSLKGAEINDSSAPGEDE